MKTIRTASMIALSLALATGGVAATTFAPRAAMAAEKAKVLTPAVFKPVSEGQAALKAGKVKDAIAKLEEADKIAKKTPYETYIVNILLSAAYGQTQDYNNAIRTLEAAQNSGEMLAADSVNALKQITASYYSMKNYPKTIDYAQRYLQAAPGDLDIMNLVSQSYYIQNNFKSASESTRSTIKAAQTASKPVKEEWLQLLMSSEFKQDNNAGVMAALEQLVVTHPKDQYWKDLIRLNEAAMKGATNKNNLDIYGIKFFLGLVATAEEYSEMTQVALQEGLPGVAKRVMEKGVGAGVLGQGAQKERESRLLTKANADAAADQSSLAKGEAEAKNQKSGDALVKYGEAYASYGQYDKAIEVIQAGIAKGLQNGDEGKLRLGIVYIQSGKRAQGLDAFKGITAGSVPAHLAKLWSLASASKKA
ncbi:MAG: hypothetical protein EXQ84_07405 [Rhodospirillaceae bacterium]|nr:hypothetical protein [Rhodospirillaceae bacterium]